ncbi:TPA: aldo/keto reductase [Klebsiella pneumoniae]
MTTDSILLNDGYYMPRPGCGLWLIDNRDVDSLIRQALKAGFRHFDTAQAYFNEDGVGRALRYTEVPREQLFITSKIRGRDMGYARTLVSFNETLERLGVEYLELFLIHWPIPAKNLYVETWEASIELEASGLIRSIGVSNFTCQHIERLIEDTGVVPAVNQLELHPHFQQCDVRDYHHEAGIAIQSYSPFGSNGAAVLRNAVVMVLARRHDHSPAQIVLRWHLQQGLTTLPRTTNGARFSENVDVWDFELSEEEMKLLASLNTRTGNTQPLPDAMNMSF